ncbi:MAG: sugar nucleotide-binding protein [Rhodocyclaceae bacterium]|nr:sugar nucleotide-binding protein [Rhodocyclaceae bacterium]
MSGTLAPVVAVHAAQRGFVVAAWDRKIVSASDVRAGTEYLANARCQAILHLALGETSWAAMLAKHAADYKLPFVYVSTAMVFDRLPNGPHQITDERTARDEYGQYKIRCEDAIRAVNPKSSIVRIGWQIDEKAVGNNMLAHLDEQQMRNGRIMASRGWRPACSFMSDTAGVLLDCVATEQSGTFHMDSNATEGHTFDEIVTALKKQYRRDHWNIEVDESYVHDQRLKAPAMLGPHLSARLPSLLTAATAIAPDIDKFTFD